MGKIDDAIKKFEQELARHKNKSFADPVIKYLIGRCREDEGFAEDVLREGKTFDKCFNYIISQARKEARDRVAAVQDETVYEWAEDYYRMSLEQEKQAKITASKPADVKVKGPADADQGDEAEEPAPKKKKKPVLKDAVKIEVKKEKKPKAPKSNEIEGQMSLFAMMEA